MPIKVLKHRDLKGKAGESRKTFISHAAPWRLPLFCPQIFYKNEHAMPDSPIPETKALHRHRLGVSLFFFILGVNFASWAGRIPDIQTTLELNDAELGTALFAAPLGQFPAMLAAGFLVERFGSRAVLALGLALYAAALLGLGAAASFWQLFAALIIFGAGGNLFDNAVNTQAVGVEKLYGRSIMAAFHGLWSLGGVAGGLLGSMLAASRISPLAHFLGVFIFSLLAWAALRAWLLPRDSLKPHDNKPAPVSLFIRPGWYLALLGAIACVTMATEGTMYDWSSIFYARTLDAPTPLVRLGYIVCMAAMVCGRFLVDGLITRFGPIRVLQAAGLCMCLGLGLLITAAGLPVATLGAGLTGLGMSAGVPICFSLAGQSRRVPPSMAIALVTAISFSGFMACPPLIGHLAEAFSLRWAFVPIAVLALSTSLLAPRLRKYEK